MALALVGRVVASDTRDQGLESQPWQFLVNYQLCRKDERKRKRGGERPDKIVFKKHHSFKFQFNDITHFFKNLQ